MDPVAHSVLRAGGSLGPEEGGGAPTNEEAAAGFSVADVFYALYRHRWKVVVCFLAGLSGAAVLYLTTPRVYFSSARIMVKYVSETEPTGTQDGEVARPAVLRGDSVVNSEMETLSGRDLALAVVDKLGAAQILAKYGGGNDREMAALIISQGITTDAPRGANVIRITFQHRDPMLVQPILTALLANYERQHYAIHSALGNLDELKQKRDDLRAKLARNSEDLANLYRTNGVFSIDDARKGNSEEILSLRRELREAQLALAQNQAALAMLQGRGLVPTNDSRGLALTNAPERKLDQPSRQQLEKYSGLKSELQNQQKREQELTLQFTESSGMVQPVRTRIRELQRQIDEMEESDPSLIATTPVPAGGGTENRPALDAFTANVNISQLQNKIAGLTNSLAAARGEDARLFEVDRQSQELQAAKELLERSYRHIAGQLEDAQTDAALGASRNSGINVFETPTAPMKRTDKLLKNMVAAVGGGTAAGVAIALLLEFLLNQSVKRPIELQRLLPVPLYLSIPRPKHGRRKFLTNGSARGDLKENGASVAASAGAAQVDDQHFQPYFEALRDRILNRFETVARKPKMVAVCGCPGGAGGTATAAGLAAALSEAGDLRVLLVDLNRRGGLQFVKNGRPGKSCSLQEVLEGQTRQEALIAPNLYMASAAEPGNQQAVTSPRRFTAVVPQLAASDYDYIVFDMPVVDQISITPRLARHMDLTLLVVEAEKANRNVVKQAGSLLLEFTPNVAMVLNNTRANLPKWLQQSI